MRQEWLPAGKVAKHEGASVAGEPQEGVQLLRDAIQDASPGVPPGKVDGTRFENPEHWLESRQSTVGIQILAEGRVVDL